MVVSDPHPLLKNQKSSGDQTEYEISFELAHTEFNFYQLVLFSISLEKHSLKN